LLKLDVISIQRGLVNIGWVRGLLSAHWLVLVLVLVSNFVLVRRGHGGLCCRYLSVRAPSIEINAVKRLYYLQFALRTCVGNLEIDTLLSIELRKRRVLIASALRNAPCDLLPMLT
jgi:hypothetical protein